MRAYLPVLIAPVLRSAVLIGFLFPGAVSAGPGTLVSAEFLSGLPEGASISGAAADPAGNLILAGTIAVPNRAADIFVAKFTRDGSTRLYLKTFGGSSEERGGPIVVDAGGNVVVAGGTNSEDFPTTPGAYQAAAPGTMAGFVTKLNPAGDVVWSTLFYPGADQSNTVAGIALGGDGDVYLTGQSVGNFFFTTPGAPAPENPRNVFYALRLSADGRRVVYSAGGGVGGRGIAVDAQGNAYLLGSTLISDGGEVPITANAYQKEFVFTLCSGNRAFGFPCSHQHVTKLDAGGAVVFSTFLTGRIQDVPAAIALDDNNDIYVAGTTSSTDYPVTEDAMQKENRVFLPPTFPQDFFTFGFSLPQPQTGYLSKLSADGSRLLYSTYLGGTRIDTIGAMRWTRARELDLLAQVQSPGFPSLPEAPARCLPARTRDMPTVVRFDPVVRTISELTLITGTATNLRSFLVGNPDGDWNVISEGPYLTGGGPRVAVIDPITCLMDATDQSPAHQVSPGQLVTILGMGIGPATPATYDSTMPALPTSLDGTSVRVNGIAAPLMYADSTQINLIVPYEAAGSAMANIEIFTAEGPLGKRTIPVVARNPILTTDAITEFPLCGGMTPSGSIYAAVLNEDGTHNSCENPAKAGSLVTLFLNGTGVNDPGFTGWNPGSGVRLTPEVTTVGINRVEKVESVSWAPLGIWGVAVRVPATTQDYHLLGFEVDGVRLRKPGGVVVWMERSR